MRKRYGLDRLPQAGAAKSESTANPTAEAGEATSSISGMSPEMEERYGLKNKDKIKDKLKSRPEQNDVFAKKSDPATGEKNQTLLVVRAAKADVDAFAAGKLSFDDFKSKVTVQSY